MIVRVFVYGESEDDSAHENDQADQFWTKKAHFASLIWYCTVGMMLFTEIQSVPLLFCILSWEESRESKKMNEETINLKVWLMC